MERRCSIEGCGRTAAHAGMCHAHYMRKRRGRPLDAPVRDKPDPQAFVQESQRLMRVDRGTGSTGKHPKHPKPTTLQRAAISAALERDQEERVVRMPYVKFLDEAHQKVKTEP